MRAEQADVKASPWIARKSRQIDITTALGMVLKLADWDEFRVKDVGF
jgi:hypothetical protein